MVETFDKELIKKQYPYPIATYFAKMQKEEMLISKKKSSYQKLFLSMIDAFEITLRFLGVVVIKEYLDTEKPNEELNKLLIEKLFKKMSLGDWLSIFRDGSRYLVDEENLFFPDLNSYTIRKGSGKPKNAKIMESFDKLINVRNKFKGHSTNCTEKEYHDLYDECMPHMEAIWSGLSFLAEYEYLAVKTTKSEHVIDIYQKLNGAKDIEELEDRNIEQIAIEEGDFLIINKEGKVFNLSPLLYFYISYEEEEEYCCLYEENAIKNGFFKMINYLGILPNNQTWHFKAEENMDDYRELIQQFNRLFAYLLGAEKKIKSEPEKNICVEDYYFKMQKSIIEQYSKTYFKRVKAEVAVEEFIQNADRGYFEIVGVPGQGKTAIMCSLIQKYDAIHHLITDNAGRDDEQLMLKSLLSQVYVKNDDINAVFPDDTKALEMQWTSVLYELSEKNNGEKIVVVIDALDELNGNKNLGFLPEHLPENVYVIYSMRPVKLEKNFDVEVSYELEPFTKDDVHKYVKKYHENVALDMAETIYEISGGNPLFLKCLLENEQRGEYKSGKLPKNLIELLDRLVNSLRNSKSEIAYDLFGLIAVSPGGLSIKTLAKILATSPMEVKAVIDEYRQYLVCIDHGYRFFHKRIYEHLLEECEFGYDSEEVTQYHKMIISYCEPVEEKKLNYGFQYILYHLYKANQPDRFKEIAKYEEYEKSFENLLMEVGREETKLVKKTRFYMNLLTSSDAYFENKIIDTLKELTNLGEYDLVQDVFAKYTVQDEIKPDIYIKLLNMDIDVTHLQGAYAKAVSLSENFLADYSEEEILRDSQLLHMAIRKIHHSMFWLPVDQLIQDAERILDGIDKEKYQSEESELLFLIGGNLGVLSGDFEHAKEWVGKSFAFSKEKGFKNDELRASRKVAELLCAEGKSSEAIDFMKEYVSVDTQIQSRYQLYQLIVLGECYRQNGDNNLAEECYEKGALYAKKLLNKSWEAHAYLGLSLMSAHDNRSKALQFVEAAEAIYKSSNHIWGILMSEVVRNYCLNIHDEVDFEKLEEVKTKATENNYRYLEILAIGLMEDEEIDVKLLFL